MPMDENQEARSNETESSGSKLGKRGCSLVGVLGLGTVLLPIWFFFIGPMIKHNRLVENGVKAKGRLLSVEETGNVVNDSPELELVVEFMRQDGVLDTATTDFIPSLRSLHFYQAGVNVTAAYDPEDPDEITVVDLESGPAPRVITIPSDNGAAGGIADSLRRVSDSLKTALEELKSRIDKAK
jgi:Protein of unknown function (DUF3592)